MNKALPAIGSTTDAVVTHVLDDIIPALPQTKTGTDRRAIAGRPMARLLQLYSRIMGKEVC